MLVETMIGVAVVWGTGIAALCTPKHAYTSTLDKITRGKYRHDRGSLQIMLDNLKSFPDEWSLTRDTAYFPKTGSKYIYITRNDKGVWEYSLPSSGERDRRLDGHFGRLFEQEILQQVEQREKAALLRQFYPNLDGPLMLGKNK